MRRREVIAGLGRAAVGWPLVTSLMWPATAQVRRPQLAMLLSLGCDKF